MPKYYLGYVPKGEPSQMYYDSYHDSIRRHEEKERHFKFNIQLDDSFAGDTWVRGTFKVLDGGGIEILEEKYYMN